MDRFHFNHYRKVVNKHLADTLILLLLLLARLLLFFEIPSVDIYSSYVAELYLW